MRAPRLIAIVLGFALAATAIHCAFTMGASPLVIVLLFFSGSVP